MPFYLFAWIATLASGMVTVMQKLTSKHTIRNPWLLNFVFSFFALMFTIPLAIANHVTIPTEWLYIFIASFFSFLFWIFFFIALSKLDVTVISPLFNFRGIFGLILGVIFLGEIIRIGQLILIIITIIAAIFVTFDEKFRLSSFFKPAVGFALLAMLSLAFNGLFINKASASNGLWELTLWQGIFSQILLLFTIPFFIKDLKTLNKKQLMAAAVIALTNLLYNLAANKAYSANVGLTSVIISLPASMIIAFFFSIFAPKLLEKHTLKVYCIRFVAAAIMIICAFRLSG